MTPMQIVALYPISATFERLTVFSMRLQNTGARPTIRRHDSGDEASKHSTRPIFHIRQENRHHEGLSSEVKIESEDDRSQKLHVDGPSVSYCYSRGDRCIRTVMQVCQYARPDIRGNLLTCLFEEKMYR